VNIEKLEEIISAERLLSMVIDGINTNWIIERIRTHEIIRKIIRYFLIFISFFNKSINEKISKGENKISRLYGNTIDKSGWIYEIINDIFWKTIIKI